jgi:hypothetical protein
MPADEKPTPDSRQELVSGVRPRPWSEISGRLYLRDEFGQEEGLAHPPGA